PNRVHRRKRRWPGSVRPRRTVNNAMPRCAAARGKAGQTLRSCGEETPSPSHGMPLAAFVARRTNPFGGEAIAEKKFQTMARQGVAKQNENPRRAPEARMTYDFHRSRH